MQLQISNLPSGVTEGDIRQLLHALNDIRCVCICSNGNPENMMSWVDINCSRVEINAIAFRINSTNWHGRHLNGYASLFFQ
ncbi:MAG: hypothetical protein LJE74_06880 [Proteobacteria bacterium]|jgi:hypothetical protein|nr:hypothetical protein [Pseudomonadota bacterium]